MDDSTIICDEIIEVVAKLNNKAKWSNKVKLNDETNFNEKKAACKTQNFYILLAFLLITIALLIAVGIYCYLIKYQAKQLLPFHYTNNELREVLY